MSFLPPEIGHACSLSDANDFYIEQGVHFTMKNIFHRKLPPGWKCIRNYIWKVIKLTHLASDSPLDTCALCCRWDEIAHAASQLATQWPPPAATGRVCKALITAVGQCGARDEWLSLTLMMRTEAAES